MTIRGRAIHINHTPEAQEPSLPRFEYVEMTMTEKKKWVMMCR
jgi:hypothetical protein